MQEGSFIWSRLERRYQAVVKRLDWIWAIALLVAAVIIFTINLGELPLRDWDEGTVAQVAREIWRAPAGSLHWLFPTLGGEPYHNKPPLMHLLIAWAYSLAGVNEWTTRLPGAILTAMSVPLLYYVGREIFHQRMVSVYSALVYLTMLPVVRHGRLAMLDGASVFFFMVMMLCALRSRRNLRYCLGVGIGLGLICLTKGMLGLLLGAIAFTFLYWDTPRLLLNKYMWIGLIIGCLPVGFWYFAQWEHYGHTFTQIGMVEQSLSRIWQPVEGHKQPPWYYLVEILKYTHPWLLFLPASLRLTWDNRNLSWAKLVLVWSCVYLVVISLMSTKLPWYVFPIYPSLALAIGAKFAEIENLPILSSFPRLWTIGLGVLAVVATGGSIFYSFAKPPQHDLQLIFAAVAGTMALAGILAERGDGQFLKVLLWGSYISLLLFMKSNYWIWELNEQYPVKPVAEMIQKANPSTQKIYTLSNAHRPSLDFYSDRTIIATLNTNEIEQYWQNNSKPYLLLKEADLGKLKISAAKIIDRAAGFILVIKDTVRL
ncbi:glycosyltransferase family 39 protein [Calothrix sp. UHCC 0171]|uniref:ArnT family glycosyltransferase n=1 Tax=Calothrix sp. UHCC 0171 TaxID=3110245 RepID=UPI002B1F4FDA|nr:glycosyltransferase family 39 protein [Calothrix sp. UHCC 0171]MEA5573829.1 glycosyltransferase family 39 protein [Calothrix sp. UHCC 0171]